jgi:hypothetical protein
MSRKRTIATMAALGGMIAAIALASGIATAAADELSDLRANQEMLQRRLDQLAQVGTAKPALPPGSGTIAGSFPRSFLIPGTDTSILIGGQVVLDAGYWFSGGSPANVGQSSDIAGIPGLSNAPLNGTVGKSRGNGVLNESVYTSRLRVETRTPTAYGQAQTVLEFDFLGCSLGGIVCNNTVAGNDGLGARLRLAYGVLGPFAAGQMWNPAADLASFPETMRRRGNCPRRWKSRRAGVRALRYAFRSRNNRSNNFW